MMCEPDRVRVAYAGARAPTNAIDLLSRIARFGEVDRVQSKSVIVDRILPSEIVGELRILALLLVFRSVPGIDIDEALGVSTTPLDHPHRVFEMVQNSCVENSIDI